MKTAIKLCGASLALLLMVALVACGDEDDTVTGQFEPTPDASADYADLSGEATLTRNDDGTEVSIRLSGLPPDTDYTAHVHAAGCDQADPGGPHYKFDPNGSDEPPNEIHLSLMSNTEGEGESEASNPIRIPDGDAGAVVLHSTEGEAHGEAMGGEEHGEAMGHESGGHSHSDKIACANLEGGSGTAAGSAGQPDGEGMDHDGEAMEHGAGNEAVETIVVRNGKPVGGVRELEYGAGDEIRFRVRSDVADEVHVHGYDLSKDVKAGGTVSFSFPADFEGIFEVELEERGEPIAKIRVNP